MKKALITGITGQDGSYLTELLLEKGYEVHGIIRRQSSQNTERIDHILNDLAFDQRVFLHYGDLTDSSNAHALIQDIQPDEVYNLAAQSHVAVSFEVPEYTAEATGVGTIRLLEAVRRVPMGRQSSTRSGLRRTIASPMGCLRAMESSSIMSLLVAERLLSRVK